MEALRGSPQGEVSGRAFGQCDVQRRGGPWRHGTTSACPAAPRRHRRRRSVHLVVSAAAQSVGGLGDWFFTESGQRDWVEAMELRSLTPDMPALLMEMGVRYDPQRLADVLANREVEIAARAVQVATSLGSCVAAVAKDYAMGQVEANSKLRARQLCTVLSGLGAAFVKIGQALSSRPDLLPQIYLETLAELQDRLQSFPSSIAMQLIEEELGQPVASIFSELSAEPVAAASLGQVYRGRLRSTGEEVAVKVQRPGIGENIAIDMVLLRRLMAAFDAALPRLRLPIQIQPLVPLVDEFAARLFTELDYVQEGANAERFQELYGSVPRIRTPRIVWAHTARRVLTMEWVDGVKLTDKAAMAAAGLDVVDFVDVGIECTLRQLLEHGYFHADPHPGNLLATRAGDLCYLDFGMMSEAPENARYAIIAHVVHLVNRDYQAMCQDYYRLEFMDRSVDTSPIAPALANFFDDVLDRSVQELNFKSIVDGLGGVLFRFPFRVPAYYALILRSLTVLEGLALQADKSYKLLGKAYPYMARRLLTDPAPELRGSFQEVVLDASGRVRWNRVENLVAESAKSMNSSSGEQLWLVAQWLLGEPGAAMRKPLAAEVARLLDSVVAEDFRERVLAQTRDPALVMRLAPRLPGEADAARRGRALYAQLEQALGIRSQPSLQAEGGGGPFGMLGLDRLQGRLGAWQEQLAGAWPQLQSLMDTQGAIELRSEILANLSRRFMARTIKLIFGPQASKPALQSSFAGAVRTGAPDSTAAAQSVTQAAALQSAAKKNGPLAQQKTPGVSSILSGSSSRNGNDGACNGKSSAAAAALMEQRVLEVPRSTKASGQPQIVASSAVPASLAGEGLAVAPAPVLEVEVVDRTPLD